MQSNSTTDDSKNQDDTKYCASCHSYKPKSEYGKNKGRHDGLSVYCSICTKAYNDRVRHSYTKQQKESLREYHKAYRKVNEDIYRKRSLRFYHSHKDIINERVREFHKRHPERRRHYQLKNKYGITIEQYKRIFKEQNGKCAICGGSDSRDIRSKTMHVDHNHETGKIRGLLCSVCNKGIGCFKDDPNLLIRAAEYVRKHKEDTNDPFDI